MHFGAESEKIELWSELERDTSVLWFVVMVEGPPHGTHSWELLGTPGPSSAYPALADKDQSTCQARTFTELLEFAKSGETNRSIRELNHSCD